MSGEVVTRPDHEEHLMSLVVDIAARCNCRKTVVGAIIVKDGRIASTGDNGTIKGFLDCIDGRLPALQRQYSIGDWNLIAVSASTRNRRHS